MLLERVTAEFGKPLAGLRQGTRGLSQCFQGGFGQVVSAGFELFCGLLQCLAIALRRLSILFKRAVHRLLELCHGILQHLAERVDGVLRAA